jgi:transketolase
MAIASKWLGAHFNRPGFDIFDFNVWTICGDGDLMEGVASEAASLAGHLQLSNLCWIYDHNHVTLDGPANWSFTEDVATRFLGYDWNVLRVADANDLEMLARAYDTFLKTKDRPTLIIVDSHIGYGSPHKQDSYEAHGEPLGVDEVKLVKKFYGWPEDAKFLVPDGVYENFKEGIGKRGAALCSAWVKKLAEYEKQFPELAGEIKDIQGRRLPNGWDKNLPSFPADAKGVATRESSGKVLNALAQNIPWLLGGSADLAKSNKVDLKGAGDFQPGSYGGRNLHFGVREHGMAAAASGMAMSRLKVFNATFFNFTDYMKPSMRLAALMEVPVIYVMTHDSIGLGEDGPTHQPIEQLAGLRAMPNMLVLRPGDANEVTEAWRIAVQQKYRPTTLVLSRQAMPTLDRAKFSPAAGVSRGGYVLADAEGGKAQVILIGTGSELSLCVEAYEKLKSEGIKARVVSMPSFELFDEQDAEYKESVLPSNVTARVSVEMAATFGWERYTGSKGRNIGMHRFGASAPIKDLLKYFGFTVDHVVEEARAAIASK